MSTVLLKLYWTATAGKQQLCSEAADENWTESTVLREAGGKCLKGNSGSSTWVLIMTSRHDNILLATSVVERGKHRLGQEV